MASLAQVLFLSIHVVYIAMGLGLIIILVLHGYERHNAAYPLLWEFAVLPATLFWMPSGTFQRLSGEEILLLFSFGAIRNYIWYGLGVLIEKLTTKKPSQRNIADLERLMTPEHIGESTRRDWKPSHEHYVVRDADYVVRDADVRDAVGGPGQHLGDEAGRCPANLVGRVFL
jgi:hypothetical protein